MIDIEKWMIEIPAGKIDLRDDRINHKWTVDVHSFLLSKYLVTQELYFDLRGENPSTIKANNHPVETVTWKEAIVFCNILSTHFGLNSCYHLEDVNERIIFDQTANGYRLPTEAEWEYACKAGTNGTRYGKLDNIAWYKNNSANSTHPVGLKEPNPWGLFDMLGNVWEWCTDIYDESVYGSYRVFRGGGWADEERGVLSTNRRRSHPLKFSIDDLGFRVARNITEL